MKEFSSCKLAMQSCMESKSFAVAHLYNDDKPMAVSYTHLEYDSIVNDVEPNPDLVSDSLPDFDTGQQLPHIRFTPCLRVLTSQVIGRESNPLIRAGKIYKFITSQVTYSYMPEYFLLDDIAESCACLLYTSRCV